MRTLTLVDAAGVRWPGAAQVGRLERVRNVAGEVTSEATLVVTSLSAKAASAEAVLGLVRGHWAIEHGPHVFAALRNTVLNLLRGAGHARIASAPRHFAAKAGEALGLLGLTLMPD